MIEQEEEVVQEKKDEIVGEEEKPEEKKVDEEIATCLQSFVMRLFGDPKQKGQMIYSALIFFVIGVLFSFAPRYMQTNIAWVINTSGILCLACWGLSFFYIHAVYPNIHKNFEIFTILCLLCAAGFYFLSESPTKIPISLLDRVSERGYSFVLVLLAVMILIIRIPDYISFYSKHKGKIKTFFTAKHTAGLILSVLAVGTASFQFIQVVLKILHL